MSFYAVSVFAPAWVMLEIVQLPMEIGVFGGRFVLCRNLLAQISTILVATLAAGATINKKKSETAETTMDTGNGAAKVPFLPMMVACSGRTFAVTLTLFILLAAWFQGAIMDRIEREDKLSA